jgi:hypothetical protein
MAADANVPIPCHCRGGHCKHHGELEPCPNDATPPISVIPDLQTHKPVPGSAYGLCETCWEAQQDAAHEPIEDS